MASSRGSDGRSSSSRSNRCATFTCAVAGTPVVSIACSCSAMSSRTSTKWCTPGRRGWFHRKPSRSRRSSRPLRCAQAEYRDERKHSGDSAGHDRARRFLSQLGLPGLGIVTTRYRYHDLAEIVDAAILLPQGASCAWSAATVALAVMLGLSAGIPRRSFHRDVYFDTPAGELRRRGLACRIRYGLDDRRWLALETRDGGPILAPAEVPDGDVREIVAGTSEPARRLRAVIDPTRLVATMELETEREATLLCWRRVALCVARIVKDSVTARAGDVTVEFQEATMIGRPWARPIASRVARLSGSPASRIRAWATATAYVTLRSSTTRWQVSTMAKAARGSPSRGCPTEPGLMRMRPFGGSATSPDAFGRT